MKDDNILGNAEELSKEIDEALSDEDVLDKEDESVDIYSVLDDSGVLGDLGEEERNKRAYYALVALGVCAIILALVIIFGLAKTKKERLDAEDILEISPGFEITNDVEYMVKTLRNAIDNLYSSNAYITMHVGDGENDVIYLLYNKNKECYMESGFSNDIAVFRDNNKAVTLTNPVQVREDMHLLALIERMLILIENGYATVSVEDVESGNGKPNKSYNLKSIGKHNIKKLYYAVSAEYADDMMENIYGDRYVKENQSEDFIDSEDLDAFTIQVVIGDDKELGASASVDIDGFTHNMWWFDGYMELSGFELDKAWYEEDNNLATWVNMAEEIQATLSDNIQEYLDNNLTDTEVEALVDDDETTKLPISEFVKPEGELTAEEEAWWDYIEQIHNKIKNGDTVTEQEKSDYYALPASGEIELD